MEDIKSMTKEELLDYLESISKQLDNIALDQISIAIEELQFLKGQLKKENERIIIEKAEALQEVRKYKAKVKDSIPKSLVKEKIEELDDIKLCEGNINQAIIEDKIKLLQDLLGEEK